MSSALEDAIYDHLIERFAETLHAVLKGVSNLYAGDSDATWSRTESAMTAAMRELAHSLVDVIEHA